MSKTVTILRGKQKIYLYEAASAEVIDPRHFKDLHIMGDGEFIRAPLDLKDKAATLRFDSEGVPGKVKLAPAPKALLVALKTEQTELLAKPAMKTSRIRINTILLDNNGRDFGQADVDAKVVSIDSIRQRTPITVRRAEDGTIHLVAGRLRLEAQAARGEQWIDVFFFEGDETEARVWQLREHIDHLKLSALQKAEYIDELIKLEEARFSRQNVAKKRGRPESGKAQAIRNLPIPGRTPKARTKLAERSSKIAGLPPEVKAEAKAQKLHNKQSALLMIADESTSDAQLKVIADIVKGNAKRQKERELEKEKKVKSDKPKSTPEPLPEEVIAAELRSECSAEFRRTWAKASTKVKREFLLKVLSWEGGKPVAKDD